MTDPTVPPFSWPAIEPKYPELPRLPDGRNGWPFHLDSPWAKLPRRGQTVTMCAIEGCRWGHTHATDGLPWAQLEQRIRYHLEFQHTTGELLDWLVEVVRSRLT